MDELRAEWARRLRAARLEKGLTQVELADMVGTTQVRLSSWELGVHIPRDEVRVALAKALGVRVSDIFTYELVEEEPNGAVA